MIRLHPAAVLSLWVGAAVFFQSLAAPALWWACVASLLGALWVDRARLVSLLRRIRVLLLATFVLFALATPGTRVFPLWPAVPLTLDGLALGASHMARLMMMVAFVAVLLATLPRERLILALQSACMPLRPLGVSPTRIAVRLSLVFDAIDAPSAGWRAWIEQAESTPPRASVVVHAACFRAWDYGVLAAVVCLLWGAL